MKPTQASTAAGVVFRGKITEDTIRNHNKYLEERGEPVRTWTEKDPTTRLYLIKSQFRDGSISVGILPC